MNPLLSAYVAPKELLAFVWVSVPSGAVSRPGLPTLVVVAAAAVPMWGLNCQTMAFWLLLLAPIA